MKRSIFLLFILLLLSSPLAAEVVAPVNLNLDIKVIGIKQYMDYRFIYEGIKNIQGIEGAKVIKESRENFLFKATLVSDVESLIEDLESLIVDRFTLQTEQSEETLFITLTKL